ncbi:hypothetical protein IWW54_000677 [Coemansia sp. RSA 2705]|nr:hypothetical protein IWW54_000677 [Coemansia sp. RSA 2705]
MASAGRAESKPEVAQRIAQWATDELGFRKKTTLVSARGEERITGDDVEPLLQGELAAVLELASTHLVSSQNAADGRRKLAIYATQTRAESDRSLEHVALRRSLLDLRTKERGVLADIKSVELENRATIQTIGDISAKRRATEGRIRELRLQILKKQLMAENLRRQTSRMRVFAQEMSTGADIAQTPGILPETADAVAAAADGHVKSSNAYGPEEILAALTAKLWRTSDKAQNDGPSENDEFGGAVEELQLLIAGVINSLKVSHSGRCTRSAMIRFTADNSN